ncbi:exostosin family protein [uncultured Mucilaginibacter sp.]|uniref:exostosin domain-containing protein n=1 Tax=uncultured Mucilaginibacter sp. TaxID=797541 RepID=UPI002623D515|nr:exostosin family protein [uncultured Mucilaginibacter sp.]
MDFNKIKLYTDLSLLKIDQPVVDLLVPFCGQDSKERNPDLNITLGRFDDYEEEGKAFIELTSLENADACLLPIRYSQQKNDLEFEEEIKLFSQLVGDSGKKTFVFLGSDIDYFDVKIKNAIIFCNTLYQSKRKSNEYAFTFFFEDFIAKYYNNQLPTSTKPAIPTIGFCGYAPPLAQKPGIYKLKEVFRLMMNYLGVMKTFPSISAHSYRVRALLAIMKSKKVKNNFIIRTNFGFGGPVGGLYPGGVKELNSSFREAYVKNIIESDYTLCVRGYGNNSIRFFEALCCGRIPVFVNTDCVLPFDFLIDWKKYCVWVEEADISRIPEKVLEFHNKLSNEEFKALQVEIRNLWKTYFTPEGFFKNLHLYLNI